MRKTLKMLLFPLAAVLLLVPGMAAAANHVVSPGESLYLIGLKYNIPAKKIMNDNGLKNNIIYPGQKLYIDDQGKYTVVPGDSLYTIAQKFGLPYKDLMKANGLANPLIRPGQKLVIPNKKITQPLPGTAQVSRGGSNTGTSISRSDFDLLARIITAEADSESYATKVAVGAVVLNRVESGIFPDSIPGVVYQVDSGRYQFEPVLNGWINRPASESAKKAASDALSGWDPTNGALYFFESWVPNKFLQARPVSIVMDSFTFSY